MKAAPVRVVFLDRDTMPPDIKLRAFAFEHELREFGQTMPNEVVARIADADGGTEMPRSPADCAR